MAFTSIDDPSVYFQTALWSGDNADTRNITNDGNSDLQPDWVWIKCRNTAGNGFSHNVWDTSSGVSSSINTGLFPDVTDQEGGGDSITTTAQLGGVSAMLSDGFTVKEGSSSDDARYVNENSRTYVAWQWKANGGTTTTNDASATSVGTIDSVYQANTDAGFSIITYTGDGNDNASFAHGLGAIPHFHIIKRRSGTEDWVVYHHENTSNPNTDHLLLNTTDATSDSDTRYSDAGPSATTITMGNNAVINGNGSTYVCYAFTEKQGYSRFGHYTGNGLEPGGPFVYTGFKPAWIIIHASSESGQAWFIVDNKRDPDNIAVAKLASNTNSTESAAVGDNNLDFLSNGFTIRTQDDAMNKNGVTFLYAAFAENPFVSSEGVPVTAR